ncbi:hypothetical protein ACA910_004357 [Epithemia clementina (nom. ined.)]
MESLPTTGHRSSPPPSTATAAPQSSWNDLFWSQSFSQQAFSVVSPNTSGAAGPPHGHGNDFPTTTTTTVTPTTNTSTPQQPCSLPDYTLGSVCSFRSSENERDHNPDEEEDEEEEEEEKQEIEAAPPATAPLFDYNYDSDLPFSTTTTTNTTNTNTTTQLPRTQTTKTTKTATAITPSATTTTTSADSTTIIESSLCSSANKMVWKRKQAQPQTQTTTGSTSSSSSNVLSPNNHRKQQGGNSCSSTTSTSTTPTKSRRTTPTKSRRTTPTRRRKEPQPGSATATAAARDDLSRRSSPFRRRGGGGGGGGGGGAGAKQQQQQPEKDSLLVLEPVPSSESSWHAWEPFEHSTSPFATGNASGFELDETSSSNSAANNNNNNNNNNKTSEKPSWATTTTHKTRTTPNRIRPPSRDSSDDDENDEPDDDEDDDHDHDDHHQDHRPLYETPYQQQPSKPKKQTPQHAGPLPSSTSSTVTASTTPTTDPGDGSHASLLSNQPQPPPQQQQQQQRHVRTHSNTSSVTTTTSTTTPAALLQVLTPFVSERHDPSQPQPTTIQAAATTTTTTNHNDHVSVSSSQPSVPTSVTSDLSHLLTPPVPEDRSERRRLAYETKKRRSLLKKGGGAAVALGGVYDGEMEPEGVRGQEAEPPPPSSSSSTATPSVLLPYVRTFGPNERPPAPLVVAAAPAATGSSSSSGKHVTLLLTPTSRPPPYKSFSPTSLSSLSLANVSSLREMPPPPPPPPPPAPTQLQQPSSEWSTTSDNYSKTSSSQEHHSVGSPRGQRAGAQVGNPLYPSPSKQQQQPQQQPQKAPEQQQRPKPILRNSSSLTTKMYNQHLPPDLSASASTSSDELLDEMRSDLMPQMDDDDDEPEAGGGRALASRDAAAAAAAEDAPSSVAAAAAAEAARTLEKGMIQYGPAPNVWPEDADLQPFRTTAAAASGSNSNSNDNKNNNNSSQDNNGGDGGGDSSDDDEMFQVDEWNRLAMQNVEKGQYDEALTRFTRVLEWQKAQHGPLHPAVASAFHNLGTVHAKRASALSEGSVKQQEAYTLALHSFQAAARTARDSLSPQHPNVAVSLVRIGFLLLQSKQYENAVITFREALRIRQLAYGPRHALVANLYNNLGVCQMHLGDFEQGKQALEHALEIQRELFVVNDNATALSSNTGSSATSIASKLTQSLEIADTLFNIGGLCLEWIRKRGHDLRRQQDAEAAFEEAFMIRTDVLGPQDALTIQVRDLLEMTRSIPKPRPLVQEPPEISKVTRDYSYETESLGPEEVLSVSTPTSNTKPDQNMRLQDVSPPPPPPPPPPRPSSQDHATPSRPKKERPDTPPEFADRVMGQLTTQVGSPDRYFIPDMAESPSISSRQKPRPLTPSSQIERSMARQGALSPTPTTPTSASRPTTPNSATRSTTPTSVGTSPGRSRSGTPSSAARNSRAIPTSPGTPGSPKGRHNSSASSRSGTPLSPSRQIFCGKVGSKNALEARTLSTTSSTVNSSSVRTPSIANLSKATLTPTRESRLGTIHVTLSTEEDDDERIENTAHSSTTRNDRIFREFRDLDGNQLSDMYSGGNPELQRITPTTKPIESERSRRSRNQDTPPVSVVTVRSSGDEVEVSHRGTKVLVRQHHVPLSPERSDYRNTTSDTVADMEESEEQDCGVHGQPQMPQNSYPFDTEENCLIGETGIDSEYGRVHIPSAWARAGLVLDAEDPEQRQREIMVTMPSRIADSSRSPERRQHLPKEKPERDHAEEKSKHYDTGNKERDEIMRRAKAFIEAYESKEKSISGDPSALLERSFSATEDTNVSENDSVDDSLQAEDGLAKLGGDWFSSPSRRCGSVEEMLADPKNHLPEIYEEACIRLKRDDVDGALPLFSIILRCQRERYGAVHEYTASALYNLGIAHLRGQHGEEALEAFEEATQTRRAILGREHPSIAVSLVKVGITNLLLHRFEEALWNFREALSIRKRALGPLHPSTARIYNNIGCVHVEFNELREARRAFETALEIQRNALSDDPDSRGIMLATATTLCNLGYLYRHRELHGKAAQALKEAADLQETVLGRSNPAVLSTLDCLADSSASGGQTTDALRYFNMILTRYRVGGSPGSQTVLRAEAVLLYKMSRVHRQRNDRESQLDTLKLALRSVRALSDAGSTRKDALERRIVYDMRSCREQINKNKMKWI